MWVAGEIVLDTEGIVSVKKALRQEPPRTVMEVACGCLWLC